MDARVAALHLLLVDKVGSQHPLIYLRGIESYEMESILQFMYLGEGRFSQERMGEFIKVAKDLEVKEISEGVEMQNEQEEKVSEIKTESKEELSEDSSTNSLVKEQKQEKKKPGKKKTRILKCGTDIPQ